jgi:hypothetical protein
VHGPGPRSDLIRGPGLVAQIMFGSGPGSGLVQIIAIRRCLEHFGLFFFCREKSYSKLRSHPMLVTQSGSRKKIPPISFSRGFS